MTSNHRTPRRGLRVRIAAVSMLVVAGPMAFGAIALVGLLRSILSSTATSAASVRARDIAALAADGSLPETLALPGEEAALVQVVDQSGTVVAATRNIKGDPAEGLVAVERKVAIVLFASVPVLAAGVGALTWWAAGRSLRPVDNITRTLADITATDLHRRVDEPARCDEIGHLADVVNQTLARLETSVDRQLRFVANASHEDPRGSAPDRSGCSGFAIGCPGLPYGRESVRLASNDDPGTRYRGARPVPARRYRCVDHGIATAEGSERGWLSRARPVAGRPHLRHRRNGGHRRVCYRRGVLHGEPNHPNQSSVTAKRCRNRSMGLAVRSVICGALVLAACGSSTSLAPVSSTAAISTSPSSSASTSAATASTAQHTTDPSTSTIAVTRPTQSTTTSTAAFTPLRPLPPSSGGPPLSVVWSRSTVPAGPYNGHVRTDGLGLTSINSSTPTVAWVSDDGSVWRNQALPAGFEATDASRSHDLLAVIGTTTSSSLRVPALAISLNSETWALTVLDLGGLGSAHDPLSSHVAVSGNRIIAAVGAGPEPGSDADSQLVFVGDGEAPFSRQVNRRFKGAIPSVGSQYVWWSLHESGKLGPVTTPLRNRLSTA